MKKLYLFLALAFFSFGRSFGQNTFDQIYTIFKGSCVSTCHNAANHDGNLDFSATSSIVYSKLVNKVPANFTAKNKGNKLVDPGYPHRSYLLRKCNAGLDPDNGLVAGEGGGMPDNAPALPKKQIELLRQWILNGAPQTGNAADTISINTYYSGKGLNGSKIVPPVVNGSGIVRIHVGRIFIPAGGESEYYLKYDLKLADTVKVNRIDLKMADAAHHFIVYKFQPGKSASYPEGLRLQDPVTGANSSNGENTFVNAWQASGDDKLPFGTAYVWEKGTVLDLNYHVHNPNADSVLAADVYLDVYTENKSTPADIMYSDLITNLDIPIKNDHKDTTFSSPYNEPASTDTWYLYSLTSHTHKYGKDFDIYLRNSDGTKGDQIFEGFFNTDYTFNQGFYDWSHPPTERFTPLKEINPRDGLIQEATFNNTGSAPVNFGLTTKDEMMLFYLQYTKTKKYYSTGINEGASRTEAVSVYPNPAKDMIKLNFNLNESSNLNITVYNLLGDRLMDISKKAGKGVSVEQVDISNLQSGVYFIKTVVNNTATQTLKFIKAE